MASVRVTRAFIGPVGSLRGDRRAVLDMPFRLLLATAVMAVVLSAGLGALSAHSRQEVEQGLRREALGLASAALALDLAGVRSTRTLELRLENAPLAAVEYFRVGHRLSEPLHPWASMVRYKGAGTDEGHVYMRDAGGSPLPACTVSGGTLELGPGCHRLLMTKLLSMSTGGAYIQLEVVD